jgi:hypothetical protein
VLTAMIPGACLMVLPHKTNVRNPSLTETWAHFCRHSLTITGKSIVFKKKTGAPARQLSLFFHVFARMKQDSDFKEQGRAGKYMEQVNSDLEIQDLCVMFIQDYIKCS